jgi:hypothetical protein
MRTRSTALSFFVLLSIATAGCARAVSVGTEPGPVYAVQVRNTLPRDMIVSYDAGSGPAILGTVRANGSERFVISVRMPGTVSITARDESGTRLSGPYPVQLQSGVTAEVSLRQP